MEVDDEMEASQDGKDQQVTEWVTERVQRTKAFRALTCFDLFAEASEAAKKVFEDLLDKVRRAGLAHVSFQIGR